MNNYLEQFSEERLEEIIECSEINDNSEMAALARIALAAKQAKPVGYAVNNAFFRQYMTASLYSCEMKQPIEILYTTPPANSTVVADGWIKCSDRMPDSKNDVQLFCGDTREQFVGFHRGNGVFQFFIMNDVIGECEPTHWMLLPAAPKPESE